MAEQAVQERQEATARVREEARRQRAEEERQRQEMERQRQASQALIPKDSQHAFPLLRLPESSLVLQIQDAYRQLALKYRPDLGGSHPMRVALNRTYALACAYAKGHTVA